MPLLVIEAMPVGKLLDARLGPDACGVVDHAGSALGAASIRRLDAAGFEGTSKPLIHVRPEDLHALVPLVDRVSTSWSAGSSQLLHPRHLRVGERRAADERAIH